MENFPALKIDSPAEALNQLMELVAEVPFGNSDFQNQHSIVNMELSPHRAYRHAALRITNRIQALNECQLSLRRKAIEIKKLERKLLNETDELEQELIEIDIEEIKSTIPYTQKLVNDAIAEIKSLELVILSVGKLSRKEFEAAERKHFENRSHLSESERYVAAFDNKLYEKMTNGALSATNETRVKITSTTLGDI